jgi:cell division septation protein DedD
MSDIGTMRGEREIWITRGHLWALLVVTCCIGMLAFFLGLLVGRSERPVASVAAPSAALVSADAKSDALDELLARVEAASNGASADTVLTFPGTLPKGDRTGGALVESNYAPQPAQIPASRATPTAPKTSVSSGSVPSSGWAVQVASLTSGDEADARVVALSGMGYRAYRVAVVVDGMSRYRVRIGGYDSLAAAESALGEIRGHLGVTDAIVTPAP